MLRLRDWFEDGSVLVLDVPLACCAIETQSAAHGVPVIEDVGATIVVTPSGTITHVADDASTPTDIALSAAGTRPRRRR